MDPHQPRLVISKDLLEARLVAPAGLSRACVTAAALAAYVRSSGVELTDFVTHALAQFEATYHGKPLEMVVARATPSVKGADGRIQFLPEFDPSKPVSASDVAHHAAQDSPELAAPPPDTHNHPHPHAHPHPTNPYHGPVRRDHYAGKAHVHVVEGTRIATMIEPEQGTPGRDVLGNPTACLGAPCPIRLDASLRLESTGSIVATKAGVLNLANNLLSVSQVLDIPGALDFTIGHVDVEGDVRIGNGVRPGFKVRATGSVTIKGLVEIGDITCAELNIQGGIAGAGRGEIHVSKDAHLNYADGVRGVIGHNLFVASELTNCHLIIGEDLNAHGATIFGGEIAVTGSLHAKSLGSEAFRPTTLVLGEVPFLLRPRRELLAIIAVAESRLAMLHEEEKQLRNCTRPNPAQRERMTEFAFEASEAERQRAAATAKLAEVDQLAASKRKLHVEVAKMIHPKVKIVLPGEFAEFNRELKGPVKIMWNEERELVCQFATGATKPLSEYAAIQCRVEGDHHSHHPVEPAGPHAATHPTGSAPAGAPQHGAVQPGSVQPGKHAA